MIDIPEGSDSMPAPANRYDLKEAGAHPRLKRKVRLRSPQVDIDPCVWARDPAAFARSRLAFDPNNDIYPKGTRLPTQAQGEDRTADATDQALSMSDFDAVCIDAQVVSTTLFQCYCIVAERSASEV